MKTKKCSKCGELKLLDEFHKNKSSSDGHRSHCKTCRNKIAHQKYINNLSPEQLIKYNQKKTKKKLLKKGKYICSKCGKTKPLTEFIKDSSRSHGYSFICKDCSRKLYHKNIEHYRKLKRKYYNNNKNNLQFKKNLSRLGRKYYNKRKENPQFKLNESISGGIYRSLKGNKNGRHWEDLVDYTLGELKKHLEKQFGNEMTWNNYGSYWHIDHIIPKSKFNFTKPEHIGFKKCWALDNLQPLEAKENIRKSNKLIRDKQEHLMI